MSYPPQQPYDPYGQPGGSGQQYPQGGQPGYDPYGGQPSAPPAGGYDPYGGQPSAPPAPSYDPYGQPSAPPAPSYDPYGQPSAPPAYDPYGQPSAQPAYGQPGATPYGQPAYGAPGYPEPPKKKTGLIVGVVIGVLVLLLCVGGGIFGLMALNSDEEPDDNATATTSASSSTSDEASPSEQPSDGPNLAVFTDPDLKNFARAGANKADSCKKYSGTLENSLDGVQCSFSGGTFRILYVKYTSETTRDEYSAAARRGFRGSLTVDDDRTWSDGGKSGDYIAGAQSSNKSRFIYWDDADVPVSGEVFSDTTDKSAAETFWESHH